METQAQMLRRLAIAVALLQAVICITAACTRIMLYGDGAYFVFAIATGDPWFMKWHDISVRSAVYLTTVLPTLLASNAFSLSGDSVARLNGFLFYLVPLLQFVWACVLVWRKQPKYLVFPIIQFAVINLLGVGFVSELLLASGFLWVLLFLILSRQVVTPSFLIAFAGLVFTHELALPPALIAGWLAWGVAAEQDRKNSQLWRRGVLAALYTGVAILFIWLRLSGGGAGSDQNAMYVIDPRRVFNNPSWGYLSLALGLGVLIFKVLRIRVNAIWIWGVVCAGIFLLPTVLRLLNVPVDFGQGRYDSARSLIFGAMLGLTAVFWAMNRKESNDSEAVVHDWFRALPVLIAIALAANCGTAMAFTGDFLTRLHAEAQIVRAPVADAPRFLEYDNTQVLTPAGTRVSAEPFPWVLLYRSVVIADHYRPGTIIYGKVDYAEACHKMPQLSADRTVIPVTTMDALKRFTCTYPAPPMIDTLSRRFKRYIMGVFHHRS